MHSAILPDDQFKQLTPIRPMLMLTGFLGAGKTTLLRSLLDELKSRNHLADVILNDRENAHIDRETLQDHAESVAALTGSCVCCEGLGQLCEMILKAGKSAHELLLIELNGTADPLPLQETFTLMESKFLLQPRWQVCVIDARYFGKREQFHELEKLQLETASHYYLSHTSNLNEETERELVQTVQNINPHASPTTAPDLAEALSQAIGGNPGYRLAPAEKKPVSQFAITPNPPSAKPHGHDHHHHHHDRHQLAHEYTGCNIIFPQPIDSARIPAWLEALPESIIRVKALLILTSDLDCRFLYERVGMEVSPTPLPVRSISKVPCSGLCIGPNICPEKILEITREKLHPLCHFPE